MGQKTRTEVIRVQFPAVPQLPALTQANNSISLALIQVTAFMVFVVSFILSEELKQELRFLNSSRAEIHHV